MEILTLANTKAILDTDTRCFIKWRLTDWCNYNCSYCIRAAFTQNRVDTLERDFDKSWQRVLKAAPEVNRILNEFGRPTKIDLIGGEITFFDLPKLLDILDSKYLETINITTNLSNTLESYLKLLEICEKRNVELSLTASYHYEKADINEFFEKAKVLSTRMKHFKLEAVSLERNQEVIKIFIRRCIENNILFIVEKDLTATDEIRATLLDGSKSRPSNPRYKIIPEDKPAYLVKTRNLIVAEGLPETLGFFCTRDWNYVYIEIDEFLGHTDLINGCRNGCPVQDFHVLKEPAICTRRHCTLCGHMSLIRPDVYKDYINGVGDFKLDKLN